MCIYSHICINIAKHMIQRRTPTRTYMKFIHVVHEHTKLYIMNWRKWIHIFIRCVFVCGGSHGCGPWGEFLIRKKNNKIRKGSWLLGIVIKWPEVTKVSGRRQKQITNSRRSTQEDNTEIEISTQEESESRKAYDHADTQVQKIHKIRKKQYGSVR